jgi:hypothetical protein
VNRRRATQRVALEWTFSSGTPFSDPFDEVELDLVARPERPPIFQDWVLVLERDDGG